MRQDHIRNFAIIAHIDHGKSTLADRLLEITGTVAKRDMQVQILDSNPIERERGITIKLAPVRMMYRMPNAKCQMLNEKGPFSIQHSSFNISDSEYILNLIDTPGHVDFTYEVSRSLAACEGALLVVDATQGVQAQTLANLRLARDHNLTIIPIINKIDLPNARIEETREELEALGFRKTEILEISAKTGKNVEKVLEAIVDRVPAPRGEPDAPLRALIFTSLYDTHKGVVVFVRVVDGSLQSPAENQSIALKEKLLFFASQAEVSPIEIGYFSPRMVASNSLLTGEVGYIATGLKDIRFAKVGDTITIMPNAKCQMPNEKQQFSIHHSAFIIQHSSFSITPLPGYKEPKPMVFLGLFPINTDEITLAREAMERLRLSDSAFTFKPIASVALGNGFHCGFLGLLHAEIVQERLSREFNLNMIATVPSVEYLIRDKRHVSRDKEDSEGFLHIQSANEYPDPSFVEETKEPMMSLTVFSPKRYVGSIMQLAQEKRGEYIDMKYTLAHNTPEVKEVHTPGVSENDSMVEIMYLIPLSEMIIDFFDRLKSITEGYASLDYEFFEYQTIDVVKVDILVNKEQVDALSFLAVRDQAVYRSRQIVERLAEVIPRQQFLIPIQGAIGGQIIARSDVKAFRKDVIQKLYGGDRTRKDKLLDKQKKGKAKMKRIGTVEIPQSAFFEVLKRE